MLCNFSYEDCVELLLKHGARIDVEARMCWPGPHNHACEERGKFCKGIFSLYLFNFISWYRYFLLILLNVM